MEFIEDEILESEEFDERYGGGNGGGTGGYRDEDDDDDEDYFNSFAHEVDHIEKHIAKTLNFSPYSESASYLVGEIIRNMFYNITRKMLC